MLPIPPTAMRTRAPLGQLRYPENSRRLAAAPSVAVLFALLLARRRSSPAPRRRIEADFATTRLAAPCTIRAWSLPIRNAASRQRLTARSSISTWTGS